MAIISNLLGVPLGWIVWAIYQVVNNYGVAIIIFTVILRLLLFPISIKQQKSSIKMSAFQPMIQEINKKYAKNPQKKNEELQKLYQEEGYNPMSGCLPTIIQFLVLFGILDVVYRPLTHILHMSNDIINQAIQIAGLTPSGTIQLNLIQNLQADPGKFSALGADTVNAIQNLDMHFLGLNLGITPQLASITVIIPILAGVFSLLQSILMMRLNPAGTGAPGTGMSMKIMMFVMPLFSVWMTFSVPIGVAIYWITGYVIMIVQTLVINKMYNPEELRAEAIAELKEKRKGRNSKKVVVEEVISHDKNGKAVKTTKTVSQKEIDRRRLAAARKLDAEKYGEEYSEVTDEDLM